MFDLLITNGLVATHEGCFRSDVGVCGEVIAAVGDLGAVEARQSIDAGGRYVLPGLIDPHVHIRHPFKDGYSMDDPYSATVSAAFGGNTSVIDFAIQWDQEKSLSETLEARRRQFAGGAVIDYAFHACPTRPDTRVAEEMPRLIEEGTPSFKLYMTYSRQGRMSNDGVLYQALEQTARSGGMVGVHAENDALCCYNDALFEEDGRTAPRYFPQARANLVEAEAVGRALHLNAYAGGQLYIFHLSARESLELLRRARAAGQRVAAETCVHYLALTDGCYSRADGVNFLCSPPLRSHEDQSALWEGIRRGDISVVSSDHCGFGLEQKASGGGAFPATPNGLPGMETRLPVMYTRGVLENQITLNQMVEVLCVNPAKRFGMFPRKGAVQPGADADLVILDTEREVALSAAHLHSPVDWTPYAGMRLRGFAQTVISRGTPIVKDGLLHAAPGRGRFIPRSIL